MTMCVHRGCEFAIKTHTIDRFPRTLGEHGYQHGALADIQVCDVGHVEKVRLNQ